MPEQRFSIGESCALLDIDRVTLTRWLAAEGMQPQTDPRDKRYKYLTREQLLDLAALHDRVIRDELQVPRARLTGWQREMQQRIQQLEEELAQVRRRSTLSSLPPPSSYTPRYTPPESRQPAYTRESGADYTANTEPPEMPPSASYEVIPREPSVRGARNKLQPGEWRTLPPIPPGWKSPLDMARELDIAYRTFAHHLRPRFDGDTERYGTLDYHVGKWARQHAGNYATELLDPDQQEAARRMFS